MTTPEPTAPRPRPPARRGHAAIGARILVVGVSAAATVTLVGAMAGRGDDPAPGPPARPVPLVVVVRRAPTEAPAAPAPPAVPLVTATTAPPLTTSEAS